jgi:raffinose/stachyose/melibiose transport system substrate-binding protein
MKKKMRVAALMMAGILSVSGLTACGGKDSDSKGDSKAEGDGIELTVSHYYLEEERESNAVGDSYLAMVEQYEKDHPEVTVTQQAMSQSDYSTKIQAQAAVNEVPDVFMVKGSWVDNFVENGIIAPINDYLDKYEYKDNFREGVFDAATRDGQIYGMPNQMSITSVVYYNEALWKSIGYDSFPDNWDDIYAAAEKFQEQGISAIALGNSEKWAAESCILSTLGDRFTGTDWTNDIIAKTGNAKFTDEAFVSALGRLQNLAAKNVLNPDFNTITETQGVEYYSQGRAAAVVSGHWSVSAIQSFADEETVKNTKVAILPSEDGSKPDSISGGCGWYFAVNKNLTGEKLDAAMDFIFSTTGYEMCEYAAKEHGLMGAGLVEDVDVSAFPQLTQDFIALTNVLNFTPVYDLVMDGAVIEVMNTGIQDLLNNSKTPEDLGAEIQAEQDKLK